MAKNRKTPAVTVETDDRILTSKELRERIPLNRSTVWRMVQEGRFPAPIRLTSSRIGWRLSAVLKWLAERESEPLKPRRYFDQTNDDLHAQ